MGEGLVLWLSTKWEPFFYAIFQAGGIMRQAIYAAILEPKQEKRKKMKKKKNLY